MIFAYNKALPGFKIKSGVRNTKQSGGYRVMKTKRSLKKRSLKLNKRTIARLNYLQMKAVKVGEFYQEDEEFYVETALCSEEGGTCTPVTEDDPLFPPLTFIKKRCTY